MQKTNPIKQLSETRFFITLLPFHKKRKLRCDDDIPVEIFLPALSPEGRPFLGVRWKSVRVSMK
jgi:hypothetical protein